MTAQTMAVSKWSERSSNKYPKCFPTSKAAIDLFLDAFLTCLSPLPTRHCLVSKLKRDLRIALFD
jgi:hypothetical protein